MMPKRAGGEHRALIVEAAHQHVDAVADRAQHVLLRHLAIGEHQLRGVGAAHAELVELLRRLKALGAFLDDEGGDAPRARGAVGLGVDDEGVGHRTVGDPHFRAVEHVTIAALDRRRGHRHHIGAGARLRHGKRADMLAGNQLGQVFALLRFVAVAAELVDAEIGMGAVGEADGGRGTRDLLYGDAMGEVAQARAAIFLLHGDAVQTERAHFRPQLARKSVAAVDLVGTRRDAVGGEIGDRLAQHVEFGTEAEIEARPGIGDHVTSRARRNRRALFCRDFIAWKSRCQRLTRRRRTLPRPAWPAAPAGRSSRPAPAWRTGIPASRRSRQA